MKRSFEFGLLVLALLIFGAIVNVAVAWGCELMLPRSSTGYHGTRQASHEDLVIWRKIAPPEYRFYERVMVETGIARHETYMHSDDAESFLWSLQSGWPLLALQGSNWEHISGRLRNQQLFMIPGSWKYSGRQVPILPLWPGFAINTIFYAAILWLLFFGPGKVRRTIRRRRGLCPACAYPIGTSEVCTECGKPVTPCGQHGKEEH